MVRQEEESRRKAEEVDNEVNQNWTAVYQTITKILLKFLEDSEASKSMHEEMKEQVLSH